MDLAAGPAALGGIILWVSLAMWALGRSSGTGDGPGASSVRGNAAADGAGAVAEGDPFTTPVQPTDSPRQDAARAERHVALAAANSLGELHAEISAYRRAEQVLAQLDDDVLRLRALVENVRAECRYLGLMGDPTCAMAEPARAACACGTRCSNAAPLPVAVARAVQPSTVSVLTRV